MIAALNGINRSVLRSHDEHWLPRPIEHPVDSPHRALRILDVESDQVVEEELVLLEGGQLLLVQLQDAAGVALCRLAIADLGEAEPPALGDARVSRDTRPSGASEMTKTLPAS